VNVLVVVTRISAGTGKNGGFSMKGDGSNSSCQYARPVQRWKMKGNYVSTSRLGSMRAELNSIQLALAKMVTEVDVLMFQSPNVSIPMINPSRKGSKKVTCEGCGRKFKNTQALGPHKKACKGRKT